MLRALEAIPEEYEAFRGSSPQGGLVEWAEVNAPGYDEIGSVLLPVWICEFWLTIVTTARRPDMTEKPKTDCVPLITSMDELMPQLSGKRLTPEELDWIKARRRQAADEFAAADIKEARARKQSKG